MSDQLYSQIKATLAAIGWTYSPVSDQFEAAGQPVDWQDVMIGLPDLSLSQLDAFAERQRFEASRRAA